MSVRPLVKVYQHQCSRPPHALQARKTSVAASSRISSNRWPSRTACGKRNRACKLPWSFGLLSQQSRITIIRVTEVELRIYSIGQLWVNSDMVMESWCASLRTFFALFRLAESSWSSHNFPTCSMRDQPVKKSPTIQRQFNTKIHKVPSSQPVRSKDSSDKRLSFAFSACAERFSIALTNMRPLCTSLTLVADHPAFSTACNRADLHQIVTGCTCHQ